MLRKPLLIASLLALSGCASTPLERLVPPDPAWMTGAWLLIEQPRDRDRGACASGLPIRYNPNGTYDLFEEEGTWRLDGDRLTETATAATEQGDPAEVLIGQTFVSRIERLSPDETRKTFGDGTRMTLLRCPPPAS